MSQLNPLQRQLINQLQGGFPVAGQAFHNVAASLGCAEATLISTLREMLEAGWLSRFGPLYNPERLGGGLTLAALEVPEVRYEEVAERVNSLPQVAHNYARDHRLNMWFVVACTTTEELAQALVRIGHDTGLKVYDFPKQREYHLGLWFEVDADGSRRTRAIPGQIRTGQHRADALDLAIIHATESGLPLTRDPWQQIAGQVGLSLHALLERVETLLANGVIRRIGAVPNHYKLGFRGNGMAVWDIPDPVVDAVGELLGGQHSVSHCYRRPRHPGLWPYNLFAMVHDVDRQRVLTEVARINTLIADAIGTETRAHEVLFSTRILKKTGLRIAA